MSDHTNTESVSDVRRLLELLVSVADSGPSVWVPVSMLRAILGGATNERTSGQTKRWYTVTETADMLDLSRSTIRSYAATGKLPGSKILMGRKWYIPAEAVEALLEGAPGPASDTGNAVGVDVSIDSWRRYMAQGDESDTADDTEA